MFERAFEDDDKGATPRVPLAVRARGLLDKVANATGWSGAAELGPKLELGSGNNPTEGYEHLDREASCPHVEWFGDIRGLWEAAFKGDVGNLPELPYGVYSEVLSRHFIEHLPWKDQPTLFTLMFDLLIPGGRLVAETPNLEYALRYYGTKRLRRSFPKTDHPDIRDDAPGNLQRWLNFKLFSGGSPGDYHHSTFDREWLRILLKDAGFVRISIRSGQTLTATARKPKSAF